MTAAARPRATPESVYRYCEAGHGTTEAALYFGVQDTYIRRMKREYRKRYQDMPAKPPVSPIEPPKGRARIYDNPRLIYPALVAHGHERWYCNVCHEYMAPLPKTTGKEWNERGCYLHAARPRVPEPEPERAMPEAEPVPEPEPSEIPDADAEFAFEWPEPEHWHPATRVVRVPAEQPSREWRLLQPGPELAIFLVSLFILAWQAGWLR